MEIKFPKDIRNYLDNTVISFIKNNDEKSNIFNRYRSNEKELEKFVEKYYLSELVTYIYII